MFESMRLGSTKGLSNREIAERVARLRLPAPLAVLSRVSIPVLAVLIWTVPMAVTAAYVRFVTADVPNGVEWVVAIAPAPVVFAVCFVLFAGLLSRIGQPGIVPGKFPRSPDHPIYALRRIYGVCWTQVFYFKPLYAFCLAVPAMKWLTFRLFGYKGPLDFTVYPDSWIRDLPLLDLGSGVYLSNRCAVGTNVCLADGSILVGKVSVKPGALVGHLALAGLGATFEEGCELGIGVGTGVQCHIGKRASVKPKATIGHRARIGDDAVVGTCAYVGMGAVVGPGVSIPAGVVVPEKAEILTQEQADRLIPGVVAVDERRQLDELAG